MRQVCLRLAIITALLSALAGGGHAGADVRARADQGWAGQVGTAAVGTYVPVPPTRILDSRNGTGLSGAFAANQARDLTVVGGSSPVPAGASAIAVNVTATQPSAGGWLTVFPKGQALPTASNLNFAAGQAVANLVVVQVGVGEQVSIANTALPPPAVPPPAGTVHVVGDVVGYYTDASGSAAGFVGVTPTRVLDTRSGLGLLGAFAAGQTRNVLVADVPGVPLDASAIVLNLTATQSAAGGWLTAFPAGGNFPLASSLNFASGQTVANLVVMPFSGNGEVAIANTALPSGPVSGAGAVDVVADVVGFYKTGLGANLTSVVPVRVLDTRTAPANPIGPNATRTVDPSSSGHAVGSYTAIVANITATGATQSGYLTAFPSDASLPLASTLNFAANQNVPNLVELRVGTDGNFKIANTALPGSSQPPAGTVHVVVDVVGYFTGDAGSVPPAPAPLAPPPTMLPSLPANSPTLTQSTLVNNLNRPWDLSFLPGSSGPNGSILYTENDAQTVDAYISPSEPRRVLLTNTDIDTNGEGGTMGIAVHPDYPTNKSVYVCLTSLSGNDNRVVKYTLTVDGSGIPTTIDPSSAVPLITGMLKNSFHNGCRVRFQPGSNPPALFITMGDAGSGPSPQDPNGLNGKVLRVKDDGSVYPGNPFGKRWYTRGHRNPQGIAFRPGTNQPYNSEHGPNINDEVNALTAGGNSGWEPNTNGTYDQGHTMTDLTKNDLIRPQWRSGDSVTIAPSGLTFLQNAGTADWKSWQGDIVLAVLKNMELRLLTVDGSGSVTGQIQIAQVTPTPKRLRVPVLGPDGKLYVTTDENPGQILVFTPT